MGALPVAGMTDPQLIREVQAIVFAAETPVTLAEIARHVSEPGDIAAALAELAASYAPRGIVLVERGGRWLFQTASDLGHVLRQTREAPRKKVRGPRSRRSRSSRITSPRRAPRSRTSAALRCRRGRSTC